MLGRESGACWIVFLNRNKNSGAHLFPAAGKAVMLLISVTAEVVD